MININSNDGIVGFDVNKVSAYRFKMNPITKIISFDVLFINNSKWTTLLEDCSKEACKNIAENIFENQPPEEFWRNIV